MKFTNTFLRVGNMRKEQEFIHYPYDGTEFLDLQSDKRWIKLNIKTGHGEVTTKNGHNTSWDMRHGTIAFQLEKSQLLNIQEMYIQNKGADGNIDNVITWKNEEYLSKVVTV